MSWKGSRRWDKLKPIRTPKIPVQYPYNTKSTCHFFTFIWFSQEFIVFIYFTTMKWKMKTRFRNNRNNIINKIQPARGAVLQTWSSSLGFNINLLQKPGNTTNELKTSVFFSSKKTCQNFLVIKFYSYPYLPFSFFTTIWFLSYRFLSNTLSFVVCFSFMWVLVSR